MRKGIRRALLLALVLALLCIGALAADKATLTQDATQAAAYTVKLLDADGKEVTPVDGKYEGVEKFQLNYENATGEQLVMLLLDSAVPTENNIYYIDQKSGSGSFTIYPKQMMSGTYHLMVANTSCNKAAEIVYEADYILGDANGDGKVTVADATTILRHTAKIEYITAENLLKAADVNKDGDVTIGDATKLLRFIAKIDTEL